MRQNKQRDGRKERASERERERERERETSSVLISELKDHDLVGAVRLWLKWIKTSCRSLLFINFVE